MFEPAKLYNRELTDPSFADNAQFQTQVMDDHNWYRSQHSADPLKWSSQLAMSSGVWANKCKWGHSGHPGVGENLALGYSKVLGAVNAWALERVNYNFDSPGFASRTGHFTQMVWKKTTEVGCARKLCQVPGFSDGNPTWYLVCQYQSPGNMVNAGQFEGNVGRQISGDPKVGIPDTIAGAPSKTTTSASSTPATVPVAPSRVTTVTASTSSILPEVVVVVTVTITKAVAPSTAPTPVETANTETETETPEAPNPTSGPFWGKLKNSGASDNPFLHLLRRRGGAARSEGNLRAVMLGVLVAIDLVLF